MKTNNFPFGAIYCYFFDTWASTKTNCPLFLNIFIYSRFVSHLLPLLSLITFYTTLIWQNDPPGTRRRACDGNSNQTSKIDVYRASKSGGAGFSLVVRRYRSLRASGSAYISDSHNDWISSTQPGPTEYIKPAVLLQNISADLPISPGTGLSFNSHSSVFSLKAGKERVRKEKLNFTILLSDKKFVCKMRRNISSKLQIWQQWSLPQQNSWSGLSTNWW